MNCTEFRSLCREQRQEHGENRAAGDARWELHLLSCASCADFYAGLRSQSLARSDSDELYGRILEQTVARRELVDAQLGELCSVEPPPQLLAGVLAQTTHREVRREVSKPPRWRAMAEQIFRRPRIALEASFVLTLAWMLTFGMPTDLIVGVASAEQQMQQPLQNSKRQLVELQEDVAGFVKETLLRDSQGDQP